MEFTRILISVPVQALVDYNALARGVEASDEQSANTESQSSNSYMENEAFSYMADTFRRGDQEIQRASPTAEGVE